LAQLGVDASSANPYSAPKDTSFLGKLGDSFTNNAAGLALGAGGLGYSILQGNKNSAALNNLIASQAPSAGQAAATGAVQAATPGAVQQLQTAGQKEIATSDALLNTGIPTVQNALGVLGTSGATESATSKSLLGQGQSLVDSVSTGVLPPAIQAQIDQATQAAITQATNGMVSKGLSGDPTQNSALADQIASIRQQALSTAGTAAQSLAATGNTLISEGQTSQQQSDAATATRSATGQALISGGQTSQATADAAAGNLITTGLQGATLNSSTLSALLQVDQTQTAAMQTAIANLAKAFAPASPTVTLKAA
jgi:hypothetical protein